MTPLLLSQLSAACSLTTDSREVQPGSLFVALKGERFDAHAFIEQVARAGACAAMVSRLPSPDEAWPLPLILVPDTLTGLQQLAGALFERVSLLEPASLALTGSNGKTTTKELLRAIWSTQCTGVHATAGNFNNHIGVPLTLCAMPAAPQALIIEMGANKRGDISELIHIAPAQRRLITSIGQAHLDGFGSMDGIRAGKAEIFEDATPHTLAVVPVHERKNLIPHGFPGRVLTFGPHESEADVRYRVLKESPTLTRTELTWGAERVELCSPLPGEHNASNLAAALATLWELARARGTLLSQEELNVALAALRVPGGRWKQVELGPWLFLDDAYNANPSSVLASFEAFVRWQGALERGGARVAVIGEMLELGEGAKNWHEHVARSIAREETLHCLICVGELAPEMARAAASVSRVSVLAARDVAHAAELVLEQGEGGVVFLKASRGARLERVIDIIHGRMDRELSSTPTHQTSSH